MGVPEAKAPESQPEEIDLIHHQMDQPQSFGDFAHGHYTAVVHQVNLPFSYYRSKGPSLPRRRRGTTDARDTSFTRQTGKSTSCAFPFHTPYYFNSTSIRKDDKPTVSLRTEDDNGTPATWTFGLVFQQAIDRQDRTTD